MSRAGGKHQVEGGSTKINLVNLNQGLKKNKPGIKEDLYITLCNRFAVLFRTAVANQQVVGYMCAQGSTCVLSPRLLAE